jgi:hypothetical protein
MNQASFFNQIWAVSVKAVTQTGGPLYAVISDHIVAVHTMHVNRKRGGGE